jgi:transposase
MLATLDRLDAMAGDRRVDALTRREVVPNPVEIARRALLAGRRHDEELRVAHRPGLPELPAMAATGIVTQR